MTKRFDTKAWLRWFAGRKEAIMFAAALIFLICVAVLLVVWVDVRRFEDLLRKDSTLDDSSDSSSIIGLVGIAQAIMAVIWCMVIGEAVVHLVTRAWSKEMRRHHAYSLMFCICPALRMCARSPEMHNRIWLPGLGWRQSGRRLERQLERLFSVPMLVVALLIMPILIIEFFLKDQVAAYDWLRILLHVGTGVIWFAFAAEFILMVSIAEKKIEYCKEHWIDLAIILLPLISFMRSLSLARSLKLTNLMRVGQLSNLAQAYRLRGTAIKMLRVLIVFDLTERILRVSDEKKIARMEREVSEMEKQTRLLRQRIAKLKAKKNAEVSTEELETPSETLAKR